MERSIGLVFGLAVLSPTRFRSVREFYPCGCCTATALETEVEVPEIMPQNLVKMVLRQTLPPRYAVHGHEVRGFSVAYCSPLLQMDGPCFQSAKGKGGRSVLRGSSARISVCAPSTQPPTA